jgi:cyclic pyranopterin monophosphate synthase
VLASARTREVLDRMKTKKVLSHVDAKGGVQMVDVSAKPDQVRRAVAVGYLVCAPATIRLLKRRALPKGDVLTIAQIAGIQAAKRTAELIPLCHALPLQQVKVDFSVKPDRVQIVAEVRTTAKTGVEMEALMAVSVAALTLYDMCKAVDKDMRVEGIEVVEKVKS